MSLSEHTTETGSRSSIITKYFLKRKFTIERKLRVILISVTLISMVVVANIGFYVSKIEAKESAFNHLRSIREAKRQYVEDYFSLLSSQVSMLAKDRLIINAITEFTQAYNSLEYDNYLNSEVSSLRAIDEKLSLFYQTDYIDRLNSNFDKDYQFETMFPESNTTKILQYHYIAANDQTFERKQLMDKAKDNSRYSDVHAGYNAQLRKFATDFGFADLFLVDNINGNVVYSLNKDFAYGTNLITGIYKNTNLARLFKQAMVGSKNFVELSDYEIHIPALGDPSMFIATPVYENNERIGVLIGKIPNERIHNIITSNNNWVREGLGQTGQIYLVGADRMLRSNARGLIEDKDAYIQSLRKQDLHRDDILKINQLNTDILLEKVNYDGAKKALKGESVEQIETDARGKKMLVSATPVTIQGLNWVILGQKELDETYAPFRKMRRIIGLASLLFIVLSYLVARNIAHSFSVRIIKIRDALESLSQGKVIKRVKDTAVDEISETVSALKLLSDRINDASSFAQTIGSGNLDAVFTPFDNEDVFGQSLTQMKDSLVHAKKDEEVRKVEDEIRSWITNGVAKFAEILRQNNDSIEHLTYAVLKELVAYVDANIAGMFIINDNNPDELILELQASYAYDREKRLEKTIAVGDGLIGTCAIEKKPIYLKEIPENYIQISSGFGQSSPRSLFIVPLIVDAKIYGVIEIGSLEEFKPHVREFIERLAESIAATLVTVRLNVKTQLLLKESETRANEIAQQEEEMRQNMEEMIATQEELERVRTDEEAKVKDLTKNLSSTKQMLQQVLEKMPGNVTIKNREGIIISANQRAAKAAFTDFTDYIGSTGYEGFEKKEKESLRKEELEIMEAGEFISYKESTGKGGLQYLKVVRTPIDNEATGETNLLIWEYDYSDIRNKASQDLEGEMNEYKEKLKDTMKKLNAVRSRGSKE